MNHIKFLSAAIVAVMLCTASGCASTSKQESTGEFIDDSVITTRVKAAIFRDPALKSNEVKVETYKGVVQLSGFVSSADSMSRAVEVARAVRGVVSVTNNMLLK